MAADPAMGPSSYSAGSGAGVPLTGSAVEKPGDCEKAQTGISCFHCASQDSSGSRLKPLLAN